MKILSNLFLTALAVLVVAGCSDVAGEEEACPELEPITFEVVVTNNLDFETSFNMINWNSYKEDSDVCANKAAVKIDGNDYESGSFSIGSNSTVQKVVESAGPNGAEEIQFSISHVADQKEITTLVTDGERLEFTIGEDRNLYLE